MQSSGAGLVTYSDYYTLHYQQFWPMGKIFLQIRCVSQHKSKNKFARGNVNYEIYPEHVFGSDDSGRSDDPVGQAANILYFNDSPGKET